MKGINIHDVVRVKQLSNDSLLLSIHRSGKMMQFVIEYSFNESDPINVVPESSEQVIDSEDKEDN